MKVYIKNGKYRLNFFSRYFFRFEKFLSSCDRICIRKFFVLGNNNNCPRTKNDTDVIGNFIKNIMEKFLFDKYSISCCDMFYPFSNIVRNSGQQSQRGDLSHSVGQSCGNEAENSRCDGGRRGAKRTASGKKSWNQKR